MAKKIIGPQMILGNFLDDGRAVFFTRDHGWSADTSLAAYGEGDTLDQLVTEASKAVDANLIVDIEVIGARVEDGTAYPAHIKHAIQAKGPTVRTDLGYQVSTKWEAA